MGNIKLFVDFLQMEAAHRRVARSDSSSDSSSEEVRTFLYPLEFNIQHNWMSTTVKIPKTLLLYVWQHLTFFKRTTTQTTTATASTLTSQQIVDLLQALAALLQSQTTTAAPTTTTTAATTTTTAVTTPTPG